MTLTDRLPPTPDPDDLVAAFADWAFEERGLSLYPAQEEALLELVTGGNVILSTPTGSGKSLVAVGAHAAALARGHRTYYTAPIKALVSEKFFQLIETFGAEKVGMLTGDAAVNERAPIICCTAEILANIALREGAAADIGSVVMDEFHFYADPDRGWAWQVPLVELPQAQFLLMSATLGDVTLLPRGPHPPHRPRHRRHHVGGAPGAAALPLRAHAAARDHRRSCSRPTRRRSTSCTSPRPRPWSGRRRSPASTSQQGRQAGHRRPDRRVPVHRRVRRRHCRGWCATASACTTRACSPATGGWSRRSHRPGCSRSSAAPTPSASASTCRSAPCCSRRSPSTTGSAPARSRPASSTRSRAGRAGRATTPSAPSSPRRPTTRWRTPGCSPGRATTRRRSAGSCARSRRRGSSAGRPPASRSCSRAQPEALTSHFKVTHAMLLNVISRPGDAFTAMRHLLEDNHEPRPRQRRHILRAIAIYRALLTAGVVERLPEPDAEGRIVRIVGDLQLDFALNQPLSPFVLAVIELLDRASPDLRAGRAVGRGGDPRRPPPRALRAAEQGQGRGRGRDEGRGAGVRGADGPAGGGQLAQAARRAAGGRARRPTGGARPGSRTPGCRRSRWPATCSSGR